MQSTCEIVSGSTKEKIADNVFDAIKICKEKILEENQKENPDKTSIILYDYLLGNLKAIVKGTGVEV